MPTVGRLLSTGILRATTFDEFSGTNSNIGLTTTGTFYASQLIEGDASITSSIPMRMTSDKKLLVYNFFDELTGIPAPAFSPITFTNASASGPIGPTTAQCQSYYSSDVFSNLSVNFGYQSYIVPFSGIYKFTVRGASGGVWTTSPMSPTTSASAPTIDGYKRLPGALISGQVTLNQNDVITIVVGQGGGDDNDADANCPGGGGGTFVTKGTFSQIQNGTDTLLFFAGGGAGIGYTSTDTPTLSYANGIGQITNNGGSAPGGTEAGGTLGNGAPSAQSAGNSSGGGGYLSGPGNTLTTNFTYATPNRVAAGFRLGATGGSFTGLTRGFGGFGCGGNGASTGASDDDKGGGGGYSGGGYGFDPAESGGGGGSYIIGTATNTSSTAGGNTSDRHGSVLMEFVY
jgi:hypothetical protein